jgi:hypothetical protein
MSRFAHPRLINAKPRLFVGCGLVFLGILYAVFGSASGAQLGSRTLILRDNDVSVNTTYQVGFNTVTPGPLGSIVIEFCSNDPYPGTSCTAPTGFDVSNAQLIEQTGITDFVIDGSTTANSIVLSRTSTPTTPGAVSYRFEGVINPDTQGTYYARILTYATEDATGPSSDYGGLAFAILNNLAITAEVPPYLIFCSAVTIANLDCGTSSGTTIDFGEFSSTRASSGSSQLLAATNAKDGYSITVGGTTMTSGNNIISNLETADVSRPGVAQFGLNLKANTTPAVGAEPVGPGVGAPNPNYAQPNFYKFTSGEIIVSNPVPDDVREYTVSYLVNVPSTQASGIYVTTLTYVCLANF